MVLLWTVACCFMAVSRNVHAQYLLMILGFAAILTIFLLQFPRLFLVTILVSGVGVWVSLLATSSPEDVRRLMTGLYISIPVMLLLAGMAVYLHYRPLRRGELVVIYACVVIAIPWCVGIKACIESSAANLFEMQRRSEKEMYAWARELPWWGPTLPGGKQAQADLSRPTDPQVLAAVEGFCKGNGGQVPWQLWWRPMLYWTGMCLAFEAMLMGLLLMFRKRWIEHERLPFVWSYPAIQIINYRDGPGPGRKGWVAFALGAVLCLPVLMNLGPSGEPVSSWTALPWVGQEGPLSGYDLTNLNILPGVPFRLFWCPLVLAIFLLFPVDVLMTVALTYILTSLLLPVLVGSLGVPLGADRARQAVKMSLRFGGGIGILVWSLWYNRRAIWGYIRCLWGAKPANPESQDELGRPVVLGIAMLGLVAFVLMGSYAAGMTQMLIVTALVLIYAFSQVRQRVEGMPAIYDSNLGGHQMAGIEREWLADHYSLASTGAAVTGNSWAANWLQYAYAGQLKTYGPHNMLLEAFRIAHEFKVHARVVAKYVLLTMLAVAVITPLLYVFLMYAYGFENSYTGGLVEWDSFTQWSERGAAYGIRSASRTFITGDPTFYGRYSNLFNAAYGFIFIGILFYLRREFPRFPISPIGVVIGAEVFGGPGAPVPFSPEVVWFAFLLAWIAKSLIFRWMGVRSFREKVQPAVILFLCGIIFGLMMYIMRQISLGWGVLT